MVWILDHSNPPVVVNACNISKAVEVTNGVSCYWIIEKAVYSYKFCITGSSLKTAFPTAVETKQWKFLVLFLWWCCPCCYIFPHFLQSINSSLAKCIHFTYFKAFTQNSWLNISSRCLRVKLTLVSFFLLQNQYHQVAKNDYEVKCHNLLCESTGLKKLYCPAHQSKKYSTLEYNWSGFL